jgi:hypothetical protein
MRFLRQVSTLQSALSVDLRLLESIYEQIFEPSSAPMQPLESFVSTASSTTPGATHNSPPDMTHPQEPMAESMGPPPPGQEGMSVHENALSKGLSGVSPTQRLPSGGVHVQEAAFYPSQLGVHRDPRDALDMEQFQSAMQPPHHLSRVQR